MRDRSVEEILLKSGDVGVAAEVIRQFIRGMILLLQLEIRADTKLSRWIIEANSPTNGVRRITVLVSLTNSAVKPAVNFQMSIVRP